MPLGAFEHEVLRLLAVNRNPDSYVAGATVLNQSPSSPRTSKDVDVFHDTIESLAQSADRDITTLRTSGFQVIEAGRRHAIKLEWTCDDRPPVVQLRWKDGSAPYQLAATFGLTLGKVGCGVTASKYLEIGLCTLAGTCWLAKGVRAQVLASVE